MATTWNKGINLSLAEICWCFPKHITQLFHQGIGKIYIFIEVIEFFKLIKFGLTQYEVVGHYEHKLIFLVGSQNWGDERNTTVRKPGAQGTHPQMGRDNTSLVPSWRVWYHDGLLASDSNGSILSWTIEKQQQGRNTAVRSKQLRACGLATKESGKDVRVAP